MTDEIKTSLKPRNVMVYWDNGVGVPLQEHETVALMNQATRDQPLCMTFGSNPHLLHNKASAWAYRALATLRGEAL